MKPERWKQIDGLFEAALELEPDRRAAFLDQACAGDATLRKEVESLLASDGKAHSFIESPALPEAAELLSDRPARLSPGESIGPYKIMSLIGAGGMGEVYRAGDPRLGRDVAVKILPAHFSRDRDRMRRFGKEAQAASALNHPNIITIHDIGVFDSGAYIVMEYVEGKTLREVLASGPLSLRKAIQIAAQLADGLAQAHEAGIVHRDLKPENVMITKDGLAKILDFGLAKWVVPAGDQLADLPTITETERGIIQGTVGYMSPEQASGGTVDFHSDQFSFGTVLYEMLSGKRAFHKKTTVETLNSIVNEDPVPLGAEVAAPIRWVVERCLQKNPADRYVSTRDLAREIQNIHNHSFEAVSSSERAVSVTPHIKAGKLQMIGTIVLVAIVMALGTALILVIVSKKVGKETTQLPLSYHRLTYRRGTIYSARFAPDGQTVVYSAAWDGNPPEIYTGVPGNAEYRSLGLVNANILSISRTGEMAVLLHCKDYNPDYGVVGTLARVALSGGAPRELSENVISADWTPDGRNLAAVRLVENKFRLEFPLGNVLYESSYAIRDVRVSPNQDLIAFLENRQPENTYSIVSVDARGRRKTLSSGWLYAYGLAWSPSGDEVWVAATKASFVSKELHAITLSGKERLVLPTSSELVLQDIYRGPRILMSANNDRASINVLPPGETKERDLSWLDWSWVRDISKDGKIILFTEVGEGTGGGKNIIYIRKTDGSPAVRLGEGNPYGFSPDGKWVIAASYDSRQLVMIPTGAGPPRTLARGPIDEYRNAAWLPDGRRIIFEGKEKNHGFRIYLQDVTGANPHAITPEGADLPLNHAVSPDGQVVAARTADGKVWLYPLGKGEPRLIPGLEPGENPEGWSPDSRMLRINGLHSETVAKIFLLDILTGSRQLWKELKPSDTAGVALIWSPQFTPDGKSYAYTYQRNLSELYIVDAEH